MLLTKRFGEAPEAAAGAAYERTFGASGKSAVAAFGHPYEVDPTTLDGNTGIFTLGASYAPASAKAFALTSREKPLPAFAAAWPERSARALRSEAARSPKAAGRPRQARSFSGDFSGGLGAGAPEE